MLSYAMKNASNVKRMKLMLLPIIERQPTASKTQILINILSSPRRPSIFIP
jgi:hypothetical protein